MQAPRIEDVEATRAAAETWADAAYPRWRADRLVTVQTAGLNRLRQLNQGMVLFKILMGSFAAISLAVGGIGIMNVLLASVAERTREIGVRKAAGAKRSDIAAQFFAESLLISLAGTVAGALLGVAGASATTAVMRAQTGAIVFHVDHVGGWHGHRGGGGRDLRRLPGAQGGAAVAHRRDALRVALSARAALSRPGRTPASA